MANFPSSLDSGTNLHNDRATNDTIPATDHNDLVDAVVAVETKVGTGADTPTSGDVFKGTGAGTSGWAPLTLDELSDVDTTGVLNGSVIKYNSTSGHWEVGVDSTGGGGAGLPADAVGWLHDDGAGTLVWSTPSKTDVGLGNVDNTSDATKNSATATLTNKTISGSTNTLSNIPESAVTSLTTDLAAKAPLASPALTGTPTAPTAAGGTNTTQIATTAFVASAVAGGGGGGGGSVTPRAGWSTRFEYPISGRYNVSSSAGSTVALNTTGLALSTGSSSGNYATHNTNNDYFQPFGNLETWNPQMFVEMGMSPGSNSGTLYAVWGSRCNSSGLPDFETYFGVKLVSVSGTITAYLVANNGLTVSSETSVSLGSCASGDRSLFYVKYDGTTVSAKKDHGTAVTTTSNVPTGLYGPLWGIGLRTSSAGSISAVIPGFGYSYDAY